ncbi:unnamed protein product [Absidia cylindrospora]
MASSQNDIAAFLAKEQAHTTTSTTSVRLKMKNNFYKVKRATFASQLQTLFNDASSKIDQEMMMLQNTMLVTDRVLKVGAHRFYGDMDPAAFQFWTDIYGDDLSTSQQNLMWSYFVTAYRTAFDHHRHHPYRSSTWTDETLGRMKAIACVNGEDMTIGGYILLTKTCGFPLDPTKLPSMLDSPVSVSAETRSHVATSINELILFFSTEEMRNHLLIVRTWYGHCSRTPAARQARANQWAIAFRALQRKPTYQWDDKDRLVDHVDMARRTLFFFYQRVSVIFEMGQLSKDLFRRVDFPGRHRMQDFVDLIKPLDKANYVTMIGKDPEAWEKHPSKVPEVYQFADRYITSLQSKTRQEPEKTTTAAVSDNNNHSTAPNTAVVASIITSPPTPPASLLSSSSSSSNNVSLTSYHHHPVDKAIGDHFKIPHTLDISHINEWKLLQLDQAIMLLPTVLMMLLILQLSKELVLSPLLV